MGEFITEVLLGLFVIGALLLFGHQSGQLSVLRGDAAETKRAVAMLTVQVAAMGKLLLRETGAPPRSNGESA